MLTKEDVADLIDLPQAMACVEEAFRQQARGTVTPWPPAMMRTGTSHLIMRSGGLAEMERHGVRVSVGPRGRDFALLFDTVRKELLSLMAYPFTELRLAAATGVGVRALAREDARRVAMLGTGRNAPGILEAVAMVRRLESVRVYSPTTEHRQRFAAQAGQSLALPVTATKTAEAAVEGADIVLVCTSAQAPALFGDWLAPNALVTAVGNRPELDDSVFRRGSLIVTSSKVQEMNVHEISDDWPLVRLIRAGAVDWHAVAELGDVLSGQVRVPAGITVFREAQGGFTDVALAAWLYDRAVALGRGVELTIA
jgi:ornithine cyclodeaminase/alanine dehydrogenase-like protein (mu-crystallin family)